MAKQSASARNIAAINRNVQTIAKTFGTSSQQYNAATLDLYKFDVRMNKNGVIQIKNNAANRAKHQALRARRNKNIKPYKLQRMKKQAEQALKKYNKRAKDKIQSIPEFEQRQQELDELTDNIYEDSMIVQEMLSIDVDIHRMYIDRAYRDKISAMARQAEQYQYGKVPDDVIEQTRQAFDRGVISEQDDATYIIDSETGEILFKY